MIGDAYSTDTPNSRQVLVENRAEFDQDLPTVDAICGAILRQRRRLIAPRAALLSALGADCHDHLAEVAACE
ncbi:MAG: hypothetical protein ACTH70_16230, partial [Brevibacterium aurantiacum]